MKVTEATPRLGRGLAALLGETGLVAATPSVPRTIPLVDLQPGRFQPRQAICDVALAELADSIRVSGVLQPILVRQAAGQPDHYEIIAGERRWRAAQLAGLHDIPVLILALSDADAMTAALVENLQRQDINAIEEAEGYARLLREHDMTQERLGEAVGKSRSHVANTLRLLQLPEKVRMSVRDGHLSAGHARVLLTHPEPEAVAEIVIRRKLNVRQTEQLPKKAEKAANMQSSPVVDPDIMTFMRQISQHLGLKVEISPRGKVGCLKLHYANVEQLEGLVRMLTSS